MEAIGDKKGRLFVLCQQLKVAMPNFTHKVMGPPHNPRFIATVLMYDGVVYQGAVCGTKRAAEHSACEVALLKMTLVKKTQELKLEVSEEFDDCFNYKGLLQETCQKRAYGFPVYNVVKSGFDHMPRYNVFITMCNCQVKNEKWFHRLKTAEQYAAFTVLKDFSQEINENRQIKTGHFDSIIERTNMLNQMNYVDPADELVMFDDDEVVLEKDLPSDYGVCQGRATEEAVQKVMKTLIAKEHNQLQQVVTPRSNDYSSFMNHDQFASVMVSERSKPMKPPFSKADQVNVFKSIEVSKKESTFKIATSKSPVKAEDLNIIGSFDNKKEIIDPIIVKAFGDYNETANYLSMLSELCTKRAYGKPMYRVTEHVVDGVVVCIGSVVVRFKAYIADRSFSEKNEACNNAAWYCLNNLSAYDDTIGLEVVPLFDNKAKVPMVKIASFKGIMVEIWLKIFEYLPFRELMKSLPRVSQGMRTISCSDVAWLSRGDFEKQSLYTIAKSRLKQFTHIIGSDFLLKDIVVADWCYEYTSRALRKWGFNLCVNPHYEVTFSKVASCDEVNTESYFFGIIRCQKGMELTVEYTDVDSIRGEADASNVSRRSKSYVAVRRIVPGAMSNLMWEIPYSQHLNSLLEIVAKSQGGAIDCSYPTDPYNKGYMLVRMLYFHNTKLLCEIGCSAIGN